MYIIQSNINKEDFQSYMYPIKEQTWEEFKEYILSNEDFTDKIINGTMTGSIKPKDCKIEVSNINDEHHLRVNMTRKDGTIQISEYYMVTDDKFQNLIR